MRLLREPRRLFRLAGDTHSLKMWCDRRPFRNCRLLRFRRPQAGKIHRILPALAISKSADFPMGTGDTEDVLMVNSPCPPATGACHAPVHASREKIDFGANFICGISTKVNPCYQRKSGNTPRRSRYACRACSRSSALGAVLYLAYNSCRTRRPASAPIPAGFHPRIHHHSRGDTPPAPRTSHRKSAHSSFASVPFCDGCDDSDGCLDGSIFTVATVATVVPILNHFKSRSLHQHISEFHLPSGVPRPILVTYMIFFQQPAGFDIQVLGQRICRHAHLHRCGQLRGRARPLRLTGIDQPGHRFQHRVRRFLVRLRFHALQIPDLCFRVLFK